MATIEEHEQQAPNENNIDVFMLQTRELSFDHEAYQASSRHKTLLFDSRKGESLGTRGGLASTHRHMTVLTKTPARAASCNASSSEGADQAP